MPTVTDFLAFVNVNESSKVDKKPSVNKHPLKWTNQTWYVFFFASNFKREFSRVMLVMLAEVG